MTGPTAPTREVLSFGPFSLIVGERLLTKAGVAVPLGARALDLLIVLVSRPNTSVGKAELMAEVWPDIIVGEGSLRFHMSGLRKALGDGENGARYISTLAGRGYCFVAPVTRSGGHGDRAAVPEVAPARATFLPARLARLVGREEDVGNISAALATSRFVTIVGPGGVGKTAVAVTVAHALLPAFEGSVLFVDFGALSDARMVPASVASMMGLSIQSDDPVPSLIAFLRERRVLLVLDNCEHVVDDAARFVDRILLDVSGLHILATSREALRVKGEQVYRLPPLGLPPADAALTADATLSFPAAQLFVESATASGARLDLTDSNAAIVAGICRKLDGMALAIELAAGRVEAYGLGQIATLLDQRFTLLWPGKRTAPARQKTLHATLEWSYGLLTEAERVVFRHLAVFVGSFTIEAALAVVTNETVDAVWVFTAIDSLVEKSMIMSLPTGAMMRYRLLDTARAFALQLSVDQTERTALAERHATYCLRWLEQFATDGSPLLDASRRPSHLVELNNVRAALGWCFGSEGNVELGVDLAAAAAPVFFAMSLLTECQIWSQRAIAELDDGLLGGRKEMRLQAALGLSLMWTRGNSETTQAALNRSFAIAKEQGDSLTQVLLLTPLHVFHMRIGEFKKAMQYAERVSELSRTTEDAEAIVLSRILLGYSYHFAGELSDAHRELEAALRQESHEARAYEEKDSLFVTMKSDAMAAPILALASSAAGSALARTLWLRGHPAAAMEHVNRTLTDTASAQHPVTLLVALMYAVSVLIWTGDLDDAEAQIGRFISNAETYALKSHVLLGRCFEGQLAICRGDTDRGIDLLKTSLHELRALRYELLTTSFNISLVEAFTATGRFTEGLSLIDVTIRLAQTNGDVCYMPEILRVKASLLLRLPEPKEELADACLTESLSLSRLQGALAWEL